MLGVVVTLVEFSTALPYLGAIGILGAGEVALPTAVGVLVLYNVVMVLPPLGLLAGYVALGERIRARLDQLWNWIRGRARAAWLWVVGALGGVLVLNSVLHFVG